MSLKYGCTIQNQYVKLISISITQAMNNQKINNSIYNSVKKNKIFRNKFNKTSARHVH